MDFDIVIVYCWECKNDYIMQRPAIVQKCSPVHSLIVGKCHLCLGHEPVKRFEAVTSACPVE